MDRKQIISLFFLSLLIFIVWEIFRIFSPFFGPIFWSMILAFAFYPLYEKTLHRLKGRQTLSAILVTILIFLIVLPPVVMLIVNVTGQAIELYQSATDYIREGKLEVLIERVRSVRLVQSIETHLFAWDVVKQSMSDLMLNSSKTIGNFAASQVGTLTKNLLFVSISVVFMTFLTFIFLRDGNVITQFIRDVSPLEPKTKKVVFGGIHDTFAAVIRGQLLTSLTQAGLAGLFYSLLGLPVPIFFAAATFMMTLIPVVGAFGVWMPLCVYLFLSQAYIKMVLLIIGGIIISTVDNFLKPALIGEKTKLPYSLLFFGILGGLQVYGLVGVFLAPVVLSLFFALIQIYREEYL